MAHHYIGGGITAMTVHSDVYELAFTNESTGKEIKVLVPRIGAYEDAQREMTHEEARALQKKLAKQFSQFFVDQAHAKPRRRKAE